MLPKPPLQWDQDSRLCPEPFHQCPAHVISAETCGGFSPHQERCPTLSNPLAWGSSLEQDAGGEVALYTSPVATGM